MSDTVWISIAPMHASNQRPLRHSFSETEQGQFGIDCGRRNENGESLGPECFPHEIYGAPHAAEKDYRLPDLFFAGSYWAASKAAADLLRQFNLGGGGFHPVKVLKNDRQTQIKGEWFCLNFGNRKEALLPDVSRNLRPGSGGKQWRMPFVPKDGDVAVAPAALEGPDIWIDPKARSAFFVSDRLGTAIGKARLKGFFLSKCRVI